MPAAGPNQRGPTCGFYALAFVMLYWYERQMQYGGDFGLSKPLEARTHNAKAPESRANIFQQGAKYVSAKTGSFYSLRHYGKHNLLTAYGSVFNAENLVKVARGNGSQYGGQFDGHVLTLTDSGDFVDKVKALIGIECPAIVPFDVGNTGDPTSTTGERAHWATIVGTYDDGADEAIHYHWGKFRYCPLADFGDSNGQLSGNMFLSFRKCEATRDKLLVRDFMTDGTIKMYQEAGFLVKAKPERVTNYEFCKPKSIDDLKSLEKLKSFYPKLSEALADDKLKAHATK
ncbi:hypothetical protein [Paludibaculum fermentans]|uniref:Uncharacterized protein n=1 Tax=Paludibaculum fermentans TaxID=1473598 RepID=A0A7S7SJC9_PALFE|nr:hypothetical protein [Paludibaculum fermentans]QOY86558.1 hypothetical protein IRI77_27720 [Paludibaculum fermentans]